MTLSLATLALSLCPALAAAPSVPLDGDDTLWIRSDRILVRPGKEVSGAVLVQNGVIVAVGEGVEAPEGARRLEGAVVCAGYFDAWSTLGVFPASAQDGRTSAGTRVADAIDAYGADHQRLESLRAGVTSVRVQAGVDSPIGGVGAVVSNSVDEDDDDLVLSTDACVVATVGVTRGRRVTDLFKRIDEVDKLIALIEAGRAYSVSLSEYETKIAEWNKAIAEKEEEIEKDFKKAKKKRDEGIEEAEEEGKEYKEKRYKEDKRPKAPKLDPEKAVMARVASGELPLVVEIHRAAELRAFLERTASVERVRFVLAGATEAGPFAAQIDERGIPVIVWPTPMGQNSPDEMAQHDLELAAVLDEAGVDVLFGSGGEATSHDLPLLAAMAVGHGLDRDAAFEALTLGPARSFDLDRELGSVERGKRADLLVLTGDPLDVATQTQFVVQGGEVVIEP